MNSIEAPMDCASLPALFLSRLAGGLAEMAAHLETAEIPSLSEIKR